jgi:hypothetical protein
MRFAQSSSAKKMVKRGKTSGRLELVQKGNRSEELDREQD